MLKRILRFIRKEPEQGYKNRFQRFYYLNIEKIRKERKKTYEQKKKLGICIKCKNKAIKGINFCERHRKQQEGYNEKARLRR